MNSTVDIKKHFRIDIPGIFNEAFILKKHLDQFNHALNQDVVLPPYEVTIHLSSRCNLRCQWCIGGNVPTKKGETKKDLRKLPSTLENVSKMEKLIKNLLSYKKTITVTEDGKEIKKTYGIENVSFSGIVGEPFMAKESFISAVNLLTENNIRVGVFSNTTLLDDELIEALLKMAYINISLDAGTALTYSKLKYGVDSKEGRALFHELIEKIRKLVEARDQSKTSNLEINASFVLNQNNYKEIFKTAQILKEIGISNLRIKQDNAGKNLLNQEQINKANRLIDKSVGLVDNKFDVIKIHLLNDHSGLIRVDKCMVTDLMASIGSDGNVYPCNYHPRVGGLNYGNAIEEEFQQIWEGERRKEIKNMIPVICPKVCDPFKNRTNKLFVTIKKYQSEFGGEKQII